MQTNKSTPANTHSFQPVFDDSKIYELEQLAQDRAANDGVNRRGALAVLTRSSDQLLEALKGDDEAIEAFLELAEVMSETIKYLEAEKEMMTDAATRLLWVLEEVAGD